jgi:hypothetical protein
MKSSKIFKMNPSVAKSLSFRGDPSSPSAKIKNLKAGEALVFYGSSRDDINVPYTEITKMGGKLVTRENYVHGEKRGFLVARVK